MRMLAAQIRGGLRVGATGRPIRAVVNLGIGGSDLGAFLVCSALAQPTRARGSTGPQTQGWTSRSSPMSIPSISGASLAPLDPATTLFLVTSKSFMTQETLANAASARNWLVAGTGKGVNVNSHFMATTANPAAAQVVRHRHRDILPLVGLGRRPLLPVVSGGDADRAQARLGTFREAPGRARQASTRISARRRSSATCPCCSGSWDGGTRRT
jgi:hypothetical protein